MIDIRKKILSTIQASLKRGELTDTEKNRLQTEMRAHKRGIVPAFSTQNIVDLFIEKAQESLAIVEQISSLKEIPCKMDSHLRENDKEATIVRVSNDLKTLWENTSNIIFKTGAAEKSDKISITSSFCGVAETGTLVLLSSKESPTTLNFLPEIHVVLLAINQIVPYYEDAIQLIREKNLNPRTINLITGPSRTADIEQTVQIGMHGPKQLFIFLYEEM